MFPSPSNLCYAHEGKLEQGLPSSGDESAFSDDGLGGTKTDVKKLYHPLVIVFSCGIGIFLFLMYPCYIYTDLFLFVFPAILFLMYLTNRCVKDNCRIGFLYILSLALIIYGAYVFVTIIRRNINEGCALSNSMFLMATSCTSVIFVIVSRFGICEI